MLSLCDKSQNVCNVYNVSIMGLYQPILDNLDVSSKDLMDQRIIYYIYCNKKKTDPSLTAILLTNFC